MVVDVNKYLGEMKGSVPAKDAEAWARIGQFCSTSVLQSAIACTHYL